MMVYYLQCTVHMDSIPSSVATHMQFDFNGVDQWICSRLLDHPLSIASILPAVSSAPLIFQMIGTIDTVIHRRHVLNTRQSMSFWLKSPMDTASRVFWSRIPTALATIAGVAGRPLHYGEFFGIDLQAQLCRIKIGWDVELDEDVRVFRSRSISLADDPCVQNIPRSEFPAFLNGERISFEGLADYGKPVRAAFILTHGSSPPSAHVALKASLYTLSMLY